MCFETKRRVVWTGPKFLLLDVVKLLLNFRACTNKKEEFLSPAYTNEPFCNWRWTCKVSLNKEKELTVKKSTKQELKKMSDRSLSITILKEKNYWKHSSSSPNHLHLAPSCHVAHGASGFRFPYSISNQLESGSLTDTIRKSHSTTRTDRQIEITKWNCRSENCISLTTIMLKGGWSIRSIRTIG